MIHEIGVELGKALAAKKCPIPVIDGPEPTDTTTGARERIVIEHDELGGDSITPARPQKNPKIRMIRNIGSKITIYAQAVNAGATDWEHRRRAEHVVDLVLVALDNVLTTRKNGYRITKSRFVQPKDLATSEIIAGAKYEILLSIERGIFEQMWNGDKRPEATIADGTIKGTTKVSLAHGPSGSTPETGCGG